LKTIFHQSQIKRSDKAYKTFQGKSIALSASGKMPIDEGLNIIVSHLDSPRLDLKQNPLYEDIDLAFMKTHYYGGIKNFNGLQDLLQSMEG